jgi:hypothetical protein
MSSNSESSGSDADEPEAAGALGLSATSPPLEPFNERSTLALMQRWEDEVRMICPSRLLSAPPRTNIPFQAKAIEKYKFTDRESIDKLQVMGLRIFHPCPRQGG